MKEIFLVQRKAELVQSSFKICDRHRAIAQQIQLFEGSPETLPV